MYVTEFNKFRTTRIIEPRPYRVTFKISIPNEKIYMR